MSISIPCVFATNNHTMLGNRDDENMNETSVFVQIVVVSIRFDTFRSEFHFKGVKNVR